MEGFEDAFGDINTDVNDGKKQEELNSTQLTPLKKILLCHSSSWFAQAKFTLGC